MPRPSRHFFILTGQCQTHLAICRPLFRSGGLGTRPSLLSAPDVISCMPPPKPLFRPPRIRRRRSVSLPLLTSVRPTWVRSVTSDPVGRVGRPSGDSWRLESSIGGGVLASGFVMKVHQAVSCGSSALGGRRCTGGFRAAMATQNEAQLTPHLGQNRRLWRREADDESVRHV